MRKKGLSVMLCAAMAASLLAGCGGGNKPAETTAAPAAAETTAAAADTTAAPEKSEAETEAEAKDDAASGDLIVVGYAQVGAESDWRTANTESFKSTFTEENGYKLIFDDAQQKQENQIKAIRSFIQQDVDYIVVAPVVETGWEAVLQEAQEAGIPVILSDRQMDVDESLYECWVGGNFIKEGETAGNWLADYLKAQGRDGEDINIVTLQGTIGASAQVGRTEGFGNILKQHDNWKMLDMQTGEFTQAKGQEVMESMLKKHDNINVVYCENDNEAFGAIDAIEAAGKKVGPDGDILVMSFDTTNAGLTDTLSGKIICNTECNPLHGPRVQEIIEKLEAGEEPDKIAYVDEEMFAFDDTVKSVKVGDKDFDVTAISQEIIDGRAY